MKYPEIRIRYNQLFTDQISRPLNELWGEDESSMLGPEGCEKIAESYRNAWQPYEKKIIKAMGNTLGLSFRQNIIDVHIAPWMHAFSDPMMVGIIFKPDRFVEILTHEMLHRLLTDNNESSYDTEYTDEWAKLFGSEHSWNTLVHIPVHAVFQAIFDNKLQEPERTKHDKKICERLPDYNAAWKYVEKAGYKEIIEKLRESYKKLSES